MLIAAIIAGVIVIAIFIFIILLYFLTSDFKPTENKYEQQSKLNKDIKFAGFAYDLDGDFFYSLTECWQREMGYCRLYDEASPLINLIIDCEPITFSYAGKRWLIELWKGQYGITTGCEIGIYNTEREDIKIDKFQGTFYECIKNEERLPLSFVLKRNNKVLIRRDGLHWWLTAFKLGEFSEPSDLTMQAKLQFPNREMCMAFIQGLYEVGYREHEYSIAKNTVTINYTKPHTSQEQFRSEIQSALVQQVNEANCGLYEMSTSNYTDTLDKLEYLKSRMTVIYDLFINSLYSKELYDAFKWLKNSQDENFENAENTDIGGEM